MIYTELHIEIQSEFVEILIAELGLVHYESFVHTEQGFDAYVPSAYFNQESLKLIQSNYADLFTFQYSFKEIPPQNWNAIWEASYEPIIIQEQCIVKSDFHQVDKQYPYEIIINPKMSFGTGHHETTKMMVEYQLEIDHQHKTVLDVGCGTGVLSIMAELRAAEKIIAFDIDEWAVTNTEENILVNACKRIEVSKNTIKNIKLEEDFDVILANINRNVLLEEIPQYAKLLKTGAFLVMSGFYEKDLKEILNVAQNASLSFENQKTDNQWMALLLKKN